MMEALQQWLTNIPLENFNNDRMIELITSPLGLVVAGIVIALTAFLKWRATFVIFSGVVAGIYVVRYTITDTGAPNSSMFLFIGGAVALAAFIIYFTLVAGD